MANGVQLATAYISLNVRTDNIKKQVESALSGTGASGRQAGSAIGSNIISGIREHMNGGRAGAIFAPIAVAGVRWAGTAGRAIGTALRTAIVSSISLGVGAALLGATAALTAGLDRLKTIQRAQVQLSLKLPPEEIRRVTKDIQDVVRGTPIALDEALQAVPRALSAGIKPGKELSQYVKDIADAAASTGGQASFGQIDIIFSQVLGKGKLMGEELMQLTENGVDLRSALKNAFNWDDKKLNSMVAKGKVGMKEIQQAVEQTWGKDGGLAKKMGGTFDGAVGNLKASVARLGANVLGLIFGDPKNPDDPLRGAIDGISSFTEKIDNMGKWVAAHREDIRGYFNSAKDAAGGLWNGAKKVWEWLGKAKDIASDVGSKIASGFTVAKDAVQSFIDKLKDIWNGIKTWVLDKWDAAFGPNSAIGKFMAMLGIGLPSASAAATPTNTGPSAPNAAPSIGPNGALKGTFGGGVGSGGAPMSGSINTAPGVVGLFPMPEWQKNAAAPSGYPGDSAILGRVKAGQYISEPGVGDLTQGIGDCTSAIEDLIAIIEGRSTAGRSLATGNAEQWLAQHGFTPTDKPVPGTFQVGFFNDPNAPGGGHMQATMPDGTKVNWGSDASAANKGVGNSGAWDDPRFNRHYYKKYGSGGGVWGSGSATSDSIPAMLSNGEHVLTADDVKKMGGQQQVYAFRAALNNGIIPGFAPGGAVDPNTVQDAQDSLADLNNAAAVAKSRWDEVQANADATDTEKVRATQEMIRTQRALDQAQQDLPIIMAGGTPPDRSAQNRVYDLTDQLDMANRALQDMQASDTATGSQLLQAQYNVESLKRERNQAIGALQGTQQGPNYGQDFIRSLGFIPAAAGSTSVAGTSSLAGFINMGNSVVSGVIDTGVNLANQAVSGAIAAGVAAGSFGGAAAAAPLAQMAASYGIQLAGNEAKRISQYWFGLAGIGADALLEIMSPFGVPRWLGYDYTQFAPQLGIQQAALGTLEQMGGDAINKYFAGQQNPNPVIPGDPTAAGPSGPASGSFSIPGTGPALNGNAGGNAPMDTSGQFNLDPFARMNDPNQTGAGGGGGGGSWARGGAVGIYDNGGVLKPGQLALNASRTPESILTKQQWTAMMANASSKPKDGGPLVQNLYAQDMQSALRELEKVKRRDMMQYAGRS